MERRGFLKTLAGAGLGAGMLSAWGAATPAQAAGLEDCLAVVVDVDACTGCGACVQACHERAAARVPQPVSPIPASRWGRDRKPDWWGRRNVTDRLPPYNWLYLQSCTVQTARGERRVFMPRRCLQCLNPPCVSLCPLGAARQRPTGAVYTEMSLCFGDSQCIAVCPWHIPRLQAGVGPYLHLAPGYLGYGQTFKCDFCEDIISDGKPPLCVAACPHGAQHFGPYAEMTALARRMAEERHGDLFGLQENGGTCLIYVSSIPFRDIEASLLRQGLISAGRPSLRPAGASLERENDLVGTVLAAPLAGAALAGLRLLRDHWRDKDED